MGTPSDPTEPDYEDGDSCATCEDLIFDGHTPKYVKAIFEGIIACPTFPPPISNRSFILRQNAVIPCKWSVIVVVVMQNWFITWWAHKAGGPPNSTLDITVLAAPVFIGSDANPCITTFANEMDCGIGHDAHEGTGSVRWGPDIDEAAYDAQFP